MLAVTAVQSFRCNIYNNYLFKVKSLPYDLRCIHMSPINQHQNDDLSSTLAHLLMSSKETISIVDYVERNYPCPDPTYQPFDLNCDDPKEFRISPLKLALWTSILILIIVTIITFSTPSVPLSGTIVDRRTDLPIESATVTLFIQNEKPLTTQTNSKGRFIFSHVKVGKYQLLLDHPSYYNQSLQVGAVSNDENSIRLALDPFYYVYTGVVADADSDHLLQHVHVTLTTDAEQVETTTNSQGVFMTELWSGIYHITLQLNGYHELSQSLALASSTSPIPFRLSKILFDINIVVVDSLSKLPIPNTVVVLESFDVFAITDQLGQVLFNNQRPLVYFISLFHHLYHNATLSVTHQSSDVVETMLVPITEQVSFSVFDSSTSTPIEGVTVKLDSVQEVSSPEGIVQFEGVRLDTYNVEFVHELFHPQNVSLEVVPYFNSLTIFLDAVLVNVSVAVIDHNGDHVPNAEVSSMNQITSTNSVGMFQLTGLRLSSNTNVNVDHPKFHQNSFSLNVEVPNPESPLYIVELLPITFDLKVLVYDQTNSLPVTSATADLSIDGASIQVGVGNNKGIIDLKELLVADYSIILNSIGYYSGSFELGRLNSKQTIEFSLEPKLFTVSGNAGGIKDVEVSLKGTEWSATTDEEGEFSIQHVRYGTYTIVYQHSDYEVVEQENVDVHGDLALDGIQLAIKTFSVQLTIYDQESLILLSGVSVQLTDSAEAVITDSSNDRGVVLFEDVDLGQYTILLESTGFESKTLTEIDIQADHFSNIYLESKLFTVSGNAGGIEHVKVSLKGTERSTTSNEDGDFSIDNVRYGTYTIVYQHSDYEVLEQEDVDVHGDLALDVIQLAIKTFSVQLTIYDQESLILLSGVSVQLTDSAEAVITDSSNDRGVVLFEDVDLGQYTILLESTGFESKTLSEIDIQADYFSNIYLESKLFTVSGNAGGIEHVKVSLKGVSVQLTDSAEAVITDSSNDRGVVLFEDVDLGQYTILLESTGFESKTLTEIDIQADHFSNIYLESKLFTVSGNAGGIEHVKVSLKGTERSTTSNEDGDFSIDNVRYGTYTIVYQHSDYEVLEQENVDVHGDLALDGIQLAIKTFSVQLTIYDQESLILLSGVSVQLTDSAEAVITDSSNDRGVVLFEDVDLGQYTILLESTGFESKTLSEIDIQADHFSNIYLESKLFTVSGNAGGIEDVEVSLKGTEWSATTDEEGEFSIKHVRYGTYTIVYQHSDYEVLEQENVDVHGDLALDGIQLAIKTFSVQLTIYDQESLILLSGVSVQLTDSAEAVITDSSNDRGVVLFEDVDLGQYTILLESTGFESKTITEIDIQADHFSNIYLESKLFTVSGNAGGIEHVKVSLKGTERSTTSNEDGDFSIDNVRYGTYTIVYQHSDYEVLEQEDVDVHGDLALDVIQLAIKTFSVQLTIYDQESLILLSGVSVQLTDSAEAVITDSSNDRGVVLFEDVDLGQYTILLESTGFESKTLSEIDIQADYFSNIYLESKLFTVSGNAGGIEHVKVSLKGTERSTTSNEDGDFSFQHVRYGTYTIVYQHSDYEVLEQEDVDVHGDLALDVIQLAIKTFFVQLTIYDQESLILLSGVSVQLTDSAEAVITDSSNDRGVVLFEDVDLGQYTILLVSTGFESKTLTEIDIQADHFSNIYLESKLFTVSGNAGGIEHVKVSLKGTERSTTSNEDGDFSIDNVRYGTYTIVYQHSDYEVLEQENVDVHGDLALDGIQLAIKTFSVQLTVYDQESLILLSGVSVQLTDSAEAVITDPSNDRGVVLFEDVDLGQYTILLESTGFESKTLSEIDIQADHFSNIYLESKLFTVSGNAGGIEDVEVSLKGTEWSATTDEEGEFSIQHVRYGTYTIVYQHSDYEVLEQENFDVHDDVTDLTVTLNLHSFNVNGYVVNENGDRLEDVKVQVDSLEEATTDSSGFFTLALSNGAYDVTFEFNESTITQTITIDDQDVFKLFIFDL
ncbi:hypothetical protein P9112_005895 [Eukaryota sp. TZLM1-RC]